MKRTRYPFSRLLAALMAAMLLVSFAPLLASAEEEVVVLTAAGPRNGGAEYNDRAIVKEIEERLGIRLECTDYPMDAWTTQLTLLMASDELPDLLVEQSMSRGEANKYGQEGFLLDLSQYLDLMPNFVARMEQDPALAAYSRDEYGAIYGISKTRDSQCSRAVAMAYLNNAWLERVNMEVPKTTEELYQVLKAFKEQDANGNGDASDEIPFSLTFDSSSGMRVEYVIRSAFGIYGYSSNYQLQADADGKVYLAEATENWKEYVRYLHRLYAEGLLDPDCFIQTNDEFVAKTVSDRLGLFGSWNTLDRVFGADDKSLYLDYTFFTGVASPLVEEPIYPLWNTVNSNCVVMASADTEHPEAVARLLDYFYTYDGVILANKGTEGKNFNIVEGYNGLKNYDYTGYWENSGFDSAANYRAQYCVFSNTFQFLQFDEAQRMVDNATDDELQTMLKEDTTQATLVDTYKEIARRAVKCCDDYPLVAYTVDESSQRASMVSDIQNYIKTMKAQFIIGETDIDAGWDTFIETLNAMGLERLLTLEQQAYDRYAKNL